MMKFLFGLIAATIAASSPAQPHQPQPQLELWRLDCGDFVMKNFHAWFSDTFQYPKGPRKLVGSCYLIRNGTNYMLWDTGLTDRLVGETFDNSDQTLTLSRSIADQLKQINVPTSKVETIGISHWHFDHVGQAPSFSHAKLLIGKEDVAHLRAPGADEDSVKALAHWLKGPGKMEEVARDRDVFGDGKVVMLRLPGHTPGHYALLVRLASGPVLLSGDQYHFTEAAKYHSVPSFNHDRADTLASHDRFDRIAANLGAKMIIQHEPADIAKLPAFPQSAK